MLNTTPGCLSFYLSCSVGHEKVQKKKKHPDLTICTDDWGCAWPQSSLQECFCYWVTVLSYTFRGRSSGNCFWVKSALDSNNRLVKRQPAFCLHTSTDTNTCGQAVLPTTAFHFPTTAFIRWKVTPFFLFMPHLYLTPPLISGFPVCSSAPVNMKIQPLNQTALMVSWERPLTVYHPPITSYMVSYSWVKRDVADEKTFTKTGDQSMVSLIITYLRLTTIHTRSKTACLPSLFLNVFFLDVV